LRIGEQGAIANVLGSSHTNNCFFHIGQKFTNKCRVSENIIN
jgi:hypothetical protein